MGFERVEGEDRGDITLYALSTCVWCHKTKKLLERLGAKFRYVYVDLLEGDERDRTLEDVKKHNPSVTFPTTVIGGDKSIVGFKEREMKEALGV
ncbi:glutaredoxin family protein [Methanothrix harundinacea]|jgi:glutaredoxin|uniref:Glutaredoxin n=1 Tax=Methanothrix harundinacea (strain 6Ac) TaxID=1110509 RepID=G7WQB7_METH6|nr:glutaredoxin family protein [Methanothrix harundinacea]AET65470.1 Glutaredoxin [Methanothrix harundinacea 6Ac]